MTLGVYVQVPFCQTKCTYCNFHTGPVAKSLYNPFVEAVVREIELWATSSEKWLKAAVDTVYVGGGTPSLLEPATLSRVLEALQERFDCAWTEVTLEADPETITSGKAAAWRAAGFNRVSLGVQSFSDVELKAAGRMHRRTDIFAAVKTLRAAGFDNISCDLIAGLPHQTAASWENSIGELLALRPAHISIYMMEIDEGSRLGREVLAGGSRYSASALPSDDAMAEFYEHACAQLATSGYEHYEISNWALVAQPLLVAPSTASPLGWRSQHNLKYWRREPYLGLGAGAHSFNGTHRWANAHDASAYVSAIQQGRIPVEQMETVGAEAALNEELFLGLRLLEGIDFAAIERRYNVCLASRLEDLRKEGLLTIEGTRAKLAAKRLTVSNEVFVELLG
ncbi:MAG: radical SAM family heme chaperone HemW [Acidobacteria bacterium]|nr:radical SAM family heme chaperone HemW [Acidobacteriota bacterium]MCL5287834.1 radical SAM family heme chaperone HemW [Acidobacteriota bacterium]